MLAVSFWVLQVVAAREVRGDGREQPPADAARCARRAAWSSTATASVLVENRHSYSISIVREHTKDLNRTIRLLAAVLGLDEARRPRDRRPAPPRADLPADHDRAGRDARAGRRGHGAAPRLRAARRRRRAGADAAVSGSDGARTCSATSARSTTRRSPTSDELKSGDIVGQSGIEKIYNALLMGEDGAKRVVVNSVGREIRTLEEDPADRRQAAAADDRLRRAEGDRGRLRGVVGFNGAAVVLDPNNGDVLGFTSRAGLRPERVRGRHRSGDLGVAQHRRAAAAERPRDPGPLFAGVDLQDGGGAGGARGRRSSRPTSRCHCPATRTSTAATSSAGRRAATASIDLRHAIEQSCDVYFYTVAQHGRRRQDQQVGDAARPRREERHRPAERSAGPRAVDRVEAAADRTRSGTPGETISVGDRPGRGVGDAGLDGGLHGDARQRRHARHAAPAQGGRRWRRAGSRCRRRRRSRRSTSIPRSFRRFATVCGWSSTAPAPAAARGSTATTSSGKTGTAQVISNAGQARPPGKTDEGSARQRLVRVLRAARQPADRRRRVPRARRARRQRRRRSRTTCWTRSSRSRKAGRCRRRRRKTSQLELRAIPIAHRGSRSNRRTELNRCSNDGSTITSTGRWSSPSSRCARSAWR